MSQACLDRKRPTAARRAEVQKGGARNDIADECREIPANNVPSGKDPSMKRPIASSENARQTMKANRAVSRTEQSFRRALWAAGFRNYRVKSSLPGRPDLVIPKLSLAIFVHGCFWHACPTCAPARPRANADFWRRKFVENRHRDARVADELQSLGWAVRIVWEHEIRPDPQPLANTIAKELHGALAARRPTARVSHARTPGVVSR
jgi:DNA mismatch endonuclease (patch repair protein)